MLSRIAGVPLTLIFAIVMILLPILYGQFVIYSVVSSVRADLNQLVVGLYKQELAPADMYIVEPTVTPGESPTITRKPLVSPNETIANQE